MQTTDQPVNRRRAAVTTFASSTAITLLVSIQALVLMPMYLTHIGPRMYGAWLATGDLLVLMLAFDMGIPNILIQRIGAALAASDKRAIGVYFGTGATILILFSLALGIALWAISPFVPTWVHLHGAEAELLQKTFLLDAVALCMMLINFVFQGLARGLQQTTMVNLSSLMATLVGFSITLALLLSGYGLWSISIGVAVRGLMTLIGSLLFLFFGVDKEIRQSSRFDKEVAQDLWKNCPSLFAAGLGYGFMSNCQILLAALVLGPESAVIFGLTRKGADVARSVLDSVGNASYGGFAHLFATGDKARGRHVYREIIAVYLAVGVALMCAYIAVNPSLVGVWVSAKMFGGSTLTILIAISTLIGGWSYLSLSLYRSTNQHNVVSIALLLECACRLPAMLGFLYLFGLPGLPLGAIVTGLVSGLWSNWRIQSVLDSGAEATSGRLIVWVVRATIFALGVLLCTMAVRPSWSFVLGVGSIIVLGSSGIFLVTDPLLDRMNKVVSRKLWRVVG